MNAGKAMAIFMQIDSDKFTDEEKAEAIYVVMKMPTHRLLHCISLSGTHHRILISSV